MGLVDEAGLEVLVGDLPAVADDPREGDLAREAVLDGSDPGWDGSGLGIGARAGCRNEAEGHAVDLGVLGFEAAVAAHDVRAPPKSAADHLLAQQLGSEGAHAEDVGHRVGIPALGQHRHRNNASHTLAELSKLADSVHHLA